MLPLSSYSAALLFSSFSFFAADFTFSALGLLADFGFFTEPLGLPFPFLVAPSSFFAGAMVRDGDSHNVLDRMMEFLKMENLKQKC